MKLCYIDNEFIPLDEARLPVTDLIIQRGVGVFDSISTFTRKPIKLTAHLVRLHESALNLGIDPPVSIKRLAEIIREGISMFEEGRDEVGIRPYITAGDRFDSLAGKFTEPRYFIIFQKSVKPAPELYRSGVRLKSVDTQRFMPNAKTINYTLSFAEGKGSPEVFEILYAPEGEITEASHSSFFMVKDGAIVTAPLDRVLAGTTREIVLEMAQELEIPVHERPPLKEELPLAREAFITGSVKEILPVSHVDETRIGQKIPGDITSRLMNLYRQKITKWLE